MEKSPAKAFIALAAIAVVIELAAAANYPVGAPGGSWDLKTNLSSWAKGITFKTGDTLTFSYSPSIHNVLEVTKANYDSCTTSGPIKTYSSGKDVITLSSPGNRYFICGFPGHCGAGMQLPVDTTAASSSGSPPPVNSPPSSGSSPPTGSVPSTPATPTPAGSPPPESTTPAGSTPSGAPGSRLNMAEKVAAAGVVGVGMLMAFAL